MMEAQLVVVNDDVLKNEDRGERVGPSKYYWQRAGWRFMAKLSLSGRLPADMLPAI
jgi:hypothetical protein